MQVLPYDNLRSLPVLHSASLMAVEASNCAGLDNLSVFSSACPYRKHPCPYKPPAYLPLLCFGRDSV